MKKVLFALMLTAGFTGISYAQSPVVATPAKAVNPNAPKFQFTDKGNTYDFGKIPEGPVAEHVFEFKNTGKEPLIISNAQASCGCTTPDWPKEPILPGKKGKITVRYTTQGRPNTFTKTVYITSNASLDDGRDRFELYIKGDVTPAANNTPAGN